MRFQPKILFSVFVTVAFGFIVYSSRGWPLWTRIFPWYVGIPMLALSLVQLFLELYRSTQPADPKRSPAETGDLQVDWNIGTQIIIQRAAKFFGWLVGLIVCIWLLGFFISIPLFVLLYLKLEAREGWLLSLSLTAGILLVLIGLFDIVLNTHWLEPVIPWPETIFKSIFPFLTV